METDRTTPEDNPLGRRVLAAAMIVCTFLGLIVAIGLMLRTNLDDSARGPATPPLEVDPPAPVYQVGGDCSAGGISAQWDLRDGQLNCVARDKIRDMHRPGEDCSHDGIAANWQFPVDRWVCVPGAPTSAPAAAPAPA
uniref:hypothetical protein n=1 Tax=Nocardia takedensis TaxID=259390 RepID=UPI0005925E36